MEKEIKIGDKFGKLTVKFIHKISEDNIKYRCYCECGNSTFATEKELLSGKVSDCGCYFTEYYIQIQCSKSKKQQIIPIDLSYLEENKKEFYIIGENNKKIRKIFFPIKCPDNKNITENIDKNNNIEEKKQVFRLFIDTYFQIPNRKIVATERIRRSDFRQLYLDFLDKNNFTKLKLTTNQMNSFLLDNYQENFVRNNGSYYLKRIILKGE